MKTYPMTVIFSLALTSISGLAQGQEKPCVFNPDLMVLNLPKQELSPVEQQGLLQQVGQEKLFKDVYLKLHAKWPNPLLKSIPEDEQRHGKGVAALLTKYQLTNPYVKEAEGVFADEKLTQRYQESVTKGSSSLVDALKMAANLEEQDIVELEKAIVATDNTDVQFVYKQLVKLSRNHLRELVKLLQEQGNPFKPTVLNEADFQGLISSPKEKSVYDDPNTIPCVSSKRPKLVIEGKAHHGSQRVETFTGTIENATIAGQLVNIQGKIGRVTVSQYAPFQFSNDQVEIDITKAKFTKGSEADLARRLPVEVKGRWDGKRLEAREIKFIPEIVEINFSKGKDDDD